MRAPARRNGAAARRVHGRPGAARRTHDHAARPVATTTPAPPTPTVREPVEPESARVGTPSKNIGCYVGGESAYCEIREHDWRLPPRPSTCPAEADWGAGSNVDSRGKVRFGACATDTVLGSTRILAYGSSVRVGALRCTSERRGVTCVHTGNGHGFLLSRARYRTF